MMRILTILLPLLLLGSICASAQEVHYYQEHPHSVEISTGPPFILAARHRASAGVK